MYSCVSLQVSNFNFSGALGHISLKKYLVSILTCSYVVFNELERVKNIPQGWFGNVNDFRFSRILAISTWPHTNSLYPKIFFILKFLGVSHLKNIIRINNKHLYSHFPETKTHGKMVVVNIFKNVPKGFEV